MAFLQDTTQTYNSLQVSELALPAITLCPRVAFNYSFLEASNLSRDGKAFQEHVVVK